MNILGVSGLAHDCAAALFSDTGIIAASEENKFVRSRNGAGIPHNAIQFALARAGMIWKEIDCVAVASKPARVMPKTSLFAKCLSQSSVFNGHPKGSFADDWTSKPANGARSHSVVDSQRVRVIHVGHHVSHASSAFYGSQADRAVVLTLDERGDNYAGAVMLGEDTRLQRLTSFLFPNSLGWIFSQITSFIGFSSHRDEHKTQWLGLEGDPIFENLFLQMLRRTKGGPPCLSSRYFRRGSNGELAFSDEFCRAIGVSPIAVSRGSSNSSNSLPVTITEPLRRQLASSVQQACATFACELAEKYRKKAGARTLCLAGGLFLNPVIVSEIERNTGYEQVFVQPAAGNEGTALGSAWYVRHQIHGAPRQAPPAHSYWGPSYSNQEIKEVLDNCKTCYRFHNRDDQMLEEMLRLLTAGKIVAWFQGRAEFGPRALGNRSLLASPWAPYVKENLNEYVKHREAFRPFAISIPAERTAEFFCASSSARFMATLGVATPRSRSIIPDLLLPKARARVHAVERTANPALWTLLDRFGQRAPAPMLINTSFNLFGEPLVLSPRDAVRSYSCSGIDALFIGSFSLSKS